MPDVVSVVGPPRFNFCISFTLVISCIYCRVLIFFICFLNLNLYLLGNDKLIKRDLSCEPNIYLP